METKSKGGPKTTEGKAISKFNSIKHGLLSKEVLVDGEDKKALARLEGLLYEALLPTGMLEELLVDRVVANVWRLRRAVEVERNAMEYLKETSNSMFDLENNIEKKSLKEMLDNESIENILRYETTIERSMYKALHELERLQARRNGRDTPIPAVVDVNFDSSFRKNDL